MNMSTNLSGKLTVLTVCAAALIILLFCIDNNTVHTTLKNLQPVSHIFNTFKEQKSDTDYCKVQCITGKPCEYLDEVHLRVIVITYNRPISLKKCLDALLKLETLGDNIAIEIWIDRNKNGLIDNDTLSTAQSHAVINSTKFKTCVHLQTSNAFITGQWVDTWRPRPGSSELGLILEDDISVAPMAYKWLKQLHKKYGDKYASQIAGYTLQMENINFFGGGIWPMKGPQEDPVFLYPVLGTWGYAPHPKAWREFQDWYLDVRPSRNVKTDKIKPYVDGIVPTDWYKDFEKSHTQESMWEMWHIKFTSVKNLFTIYSNLKQYSKQEAVLLSNNRREDGLHFSGGDTIDHSAQLMKTWNDTFSVLPEFEDIAHYNYHGRVCTKECCFDMSCIN